MIFVPLPLFAVLFLTIVLARFIVVRDMTFPAQQLFAGLIGLYALQSLLLTLRWGYEVQVAGSMAAMLAPLLPVIVFLAYQRLSKRLGVKTLWPMVIVAVNWFALFFYQNAADVIIFITYLAFGTALIVQALKGGDNLPHSPLGSTSEIMRAMKLIGGALIASAPVDIYVILDFVTNEGRNVGLVVTFVQTTFLLIVGLGSTLARASSNDVEMPQAALANAKTTTAEDEEIVKRLFAIFEEDLSLRRLARKLGLPDRKVSNSVNRTCGMSVSQFVNEQRLKEAVNLLTTTDDSILAISLEVGFATKSNFNREFRRVIDMSPSAWRAKVREQKFETSKQIFNSS